MATVSFPPKACSFGEFDQAPSDTVCCSLSRLVLFLMEESLHHGASSFRFFSWVTKPLPYLQRWGSVSRFFSGVTWVPLPSKKKLVLCNWGEKTLLIGLKFITSFFNDDRAMPCLHLPHPPRMPVVNKCLSIGIPDPKNDVTQVSFLGYGHYFQKNNSPLKQMMVGRMLSFWNGPFSGAMLNFSHVNALV